MHRVVSEIQKERLGFLLFDKFDSAVAELLGQIAGAFDLFGAFVHHIFAIEIFVGFTGGLPS